MTLPVFVAKPEPMKQSGPWRHIDFDNIPRCRLCPERGPVDVESGLGLECWRVLVALPVVLEERAASPVQTLTVGEHLPPMDEMTAARARREVPNLTEQAGPAGVAVEVQLAPPPPSPRYRGPKR